MESFFYGILMGWGAAIPFGPINVEISRRNLHYGTLQGISLGLGACLADVTYLILLGLGALTLLEHPEVLRVIGFLGSLVLGWFGIQSLRIKNESEAPKVKTRSFFRDIAAGYLMTLLNPFTILFWSSILSQIALMAQTEGHALLQAGFGVLVGTLSWVLGLNFLLHYTRHRLPQKLTKSFNLIGGIILLGFACFGLIKVIFYN